MTAFGYTLSSKEHSPREQFIDAGYDHLYFHQIGDDQDGFFGFWARELQPALAAL